MLNIYIYIKKHREEKRRREEITYLCIEEKRRKWRGGGGGGMSVMKWEILVFLLGYFIKYLTNR